MPRLWPRLVLSPKVVASRYPRSWCPFLQIISTEVEGQGPMPKLRATVQAIPTVTVETLLEERASAKALMEKYEKAFKDASASLLTETKAQGGRLETDLYKVTAVPGTSAASISREKLLALGVSLKTIRKATKPGTKYEIAKVTPKSVA